MDKYSKDFKCRNCGAYCYLQVPRGTSVETYLNEKSIACERCGVRLGKVVDDEETAKEQKEKKE